MSEPKNALVADERWAKWVCGWSIAISSIVGAVLLYPFRSASAGWASALGSLALVSGFAVDATTAWYGLYRRFRAPSLSILWGAQVMGSIVAAATLGFSPSEVSTIGFGAMFVVGFPLAFLALFVPARNVLVLFRKLRTSGDVSSGCLGAALPAAYRDFLNPKNFEPRLRRELEFLIGTGTVTHRTRDLKRLDFNRLQRGDNTILYRLEGELVEVLFVPLDGVVARFEKSSEQTGMLRFVLFQLFRLDQPIPEQQVKVAADLSSAYDHYAAPQIDFRQLGRSLGYMWRNKQVEIRMLLVAVFVAVGLSFALTNAHVLFGLFGEAKTNNVLDAIAAIVVIVAGLGGIYRWIIAPVRKRRPE